jgi:uncharacterized protein YhfF
MTDIDPQAPEIAAYWQAYLRRQPDISPEAPYQAWHFGDSPEMARELADLVLSGKKIATASLLWEYTFDGEELPQEHGYSVITDFEGRPLGIIQTTEVSITPFDQVTPEFAADEGEGDLCLEYWREVHWRFFSRSCARIGRQPSERMPVVCERFRLVYR